jgi:hypothetical protein
MALPSDGYARVMQLYDGLRLVVNSDMEKYHSPQEIATAMAVDGEAYSRWRGMMDPQSPHGMRRAPIDLVVKADIAEYLSPKALRPGEAPSDRARVEALVRRSS